MVNWLGHEPETVTGDRLTETSSSQLSVAVTEGVEVTSFEHCREISVGTPCREGDVVSFTDICCLHTAFPSIFSDMLHISPQLEGWNASVGESVSSEKTASEQSELHVYGLDDGIKVALMLAAVFDPPHSTVIGPAILQNIALGSSLHAVAGILKISGSSWLHPLKASDVHRELLYHIHLLVRGIPPTRAHNPAAAAPLFVGPHVGDFHPWIWSA